VLGNSSGRHALHDALEEMGFQSTGQALNTAFKRLQGDRRLKKQVTAMDLEALVTDELREEIAGYALESFDVGVLLAAPAARALSIVLPDGSSASGSFTGMVRSIAIFQRSTRPRPTAPRSASSRSDGHRGPGLRSARCRRSRAGRIHRRGSERIHHIH